MNHFYNDIVVVGTGVAGLSLAIKIAKLRPDFFIAILSKSQLKSSNSFYAQGGIAAVTDFKKDSFENHISDTIKSGSGKSVTTVVEKIIKAAPSKIEELIDWGVKFTRNENGSLNLGLEGGHSESRIVHANDNTGEHIINVLLDKAKQLDNIHFYTHEMGIDLIVNDSNRCVGVSCLNTIKNEFSYFLANAIVLATGGSGQVYQNTTNPIVATGDGIAMAIRAGASVTHLNYYQFHPTVFFEENKTQLDLISEAVRGFGAHVINRAGERFLFQYDARGELATRDIVSKAIFSEMKKSGEPCVYIDCRQLNIMEFENHFPTITTNLKNKGFNLATDLIPIIPAAHYQCGGITVNDKGETSISCLFAVGECAESGLHGENRLASNSLLEGLVLGDEIAKHLATNNITQKINIPPILSFSLSTSSINRWKQKIQSVKSIMSSYVTIASSLEEIEVANKEINKIRLSVPKIIGEISYELILLNNIIRISQEIINAKLVTGSKKELVFSDWI